MTNHSIGGSIREQALEGRLWRIQRQRDDLLEALKALVAACTSFDGYTYDIQKPARHILGQAQAAIAKAEGKES